MSDFAFFLKSSSHLFTNAVCTYTVLSLHKIHCYVYSYLFLCPANAAYLFKNHSIGLTVALRFPLYLKGRLCYSHTAKPKRSPLHPPELMLRSPCIGPSPPKPVFCTDRRRPFAPLPGRGSRQLLGMAVATATQSQPRPPALSTGGQLSREAAGARHHKSSG